jgi:hypothetical protein
VELWKVSLEADPMKKPKKDPIQQEEEYVDFLKKRLASENYKASVSAEEFKKTQQKYEKAKFKLKMLKQKGTS